MKLKKHLSFNRLKESLSACFNKIKDHRQVNKVKHSIHDVLMSGFACMFFQDPSLLQFQKRLENVHHNNNNLRTLFGVETIPEATQMREVTDEVSPEIFRPFFNEYFFQLQRGKHLEQFQIFPSLYYAPMDGTQFFCSDSVFCEDCLTTKIKDTDKKKEDGWCDEEESNIKVNFPLMATGAVGRYYEFGG